MSFKYTQGIYVPKNPEKYIGDVTKIVYRSSWELHLNEFFDNNIRVLKWASEEIAIPYMSPIDNKLHRYFPDYYVQYINKHGEVVEELLECKPKQQTKAPRRNHKWVDHERKTYAVNMYKWDAAAKWASENGMSFRVVSENSIFS